MKKWILLIVSLVGIITGFIVEPYCFKPSVDCFIDYAAFNDENLELLNYDNSNKQYELTKVNKNGSISKNVKLDKSSNQDTTYLYQQVVADNKGNSFVLVQEKMLADKEHEESDIYYLTEKVLMFDSKENFVKELAVVDFSGEEKLPMSPYIIKIQVIDDNLYLICKKEKDYELLKVNVENGEKLETVYKFTVDPKVNYGEYINWFNDIAVTKNEKIIYADKQGSLYAMNNENQFVDITYMIGDNTSIVDLSVDKNNNVYFTNVISGSLYKLNFESMALDQIYSKDSVINKKEKLTLNDVTYIICNEDGKLFSQVKGSENRSYAVFGLDKEDECNIDYSYFPYRILQVLAIAVVISAALFAIILLIMFIRSKTTIRSKLILMFLPVYLVSMGLLFVVSVRTNLSHSKLSLAKYQDTNVKLLADYINGDEFSSLNHIKNYMTEPYIKMKTDIYKGFASISKKTDRSANYMITYIVEDGKIYSSISNEHGRLYSVLKNELNYMIFDSPCYPIEYTMDKDTVNEYYKIWETLQKNDPDREIQSRSYKDNYGDWVCVFEPIKDSSGNVVGFVENRADKWQNLDKFYITTLLSVLITILLVTSIVFVYFFFVLKVVLKPLKKLKSGVIGVSEGKFNTKLDITTKDEFSDIASAFNIMTNTIQKHVSNLVVLNNQYLKYVPKELFKLLDKDKITDVKLFDSSRKDLNILYVTFSLTYNKFKGQMSEEEHLKLINLNFKNLFEIVKNNNGVIEWFNSFGMVVIFPNSANDAIRTSMQFSEETSKYKEKSNMHMMLSYGNGLVSVLGNENRNTISVVSGELMNFNYIDDKMDILKTKCLAFQYIVDKLNPNEKFDYRFIGHIKDMFTGNPVKIYELINTTNANEKSLYDVTKGLMESGVKQYIEGNFAVARKIFTDVLKVNSSDSVAMYYVALCDKNSGKIFKDWKGFLFN